MLGARTSSAGIYNTHRSDFWALTYTIECLNGCEGLLIDWCVCSPLCVLVGDVACLNVVNASAVTTRSDHLLVTLLLYLHAVRKLGDVAQRRNLASISQRLDVKYTAPPYDINRQPPMLLGTHSSSETTIQKQSHTEQATPKVAGPCLSGTSGLYRAKRTQFYIQFGSRCCRKNTHAMQYA